MDGIKKHRQDKRASTQPVKGKTTDSIKKRKQDRWISTKPDKAKTGRGSSTTKVILRTLKGEHRGPEPGKRVG